MFKHDFLENGAPRGKIVFYTFHLLLREQSFLFRVQHDFGNTLYITGYALIRQESP